MTGTGDVTSGKSGFKCGRGADAVKLVHRPHVFPPCRDSLGSSLGLKQCVLLSPETFIHIVHSAIARLSGHSGSAAETHFREFIWTKGDIHGNQKLHFA